MSKTPKQNTSAQVSNILHSDAAAGLRRVLGIFMPEELAVSLAVSEQTVHSWRRAGEGPRHTRLGRRVYYRETDIKDWILENVGREAGEIESDEIPLDPCDHDWELTGALVGEHGTIKNYVCSKCGAIGTAR